MTNPIAGYWVENLDANQVDWEVALAAVKGLGPVGEWERADAEFHTSVRLEAGGMTHETAVNLAKLAIGAAIFWGVAR